MLSDRLMVLNSFVADFVSQQLAILRGKKLVIAGKQGNNFYYSCIDPTVFMLLDVAKQIFNNHIVDIQETLSRPRWSLSAPIRVRHLLKLSAALLICTRSHVVDF